MLLNSALDIGIREVDFWEMTIAEVNRAIKSYNRMKLESLKEKANYDYILAHLLSRGFGIVMGSKQTFPSIGEVYPNLFKSEGQETEEQKKIQEQKNNLSTLRFLQFAQSYNKRFNKSGGAKEDK